MQSNDQADQGCEISDMSLAWMMMDQLPDSGRKALVRFENREVALQGHQIDCGHQQCLTVVNRLNFYLLLDINKSVVGTGDSRGTYLV